MKMNTMDWIGMILLIVGGLNWGLVGIFDFDLVASIFGDMSTMSRIVYALVGVAAVWTLLKAMMGNKGSSASAGTMPKPM